MAGRSRAALHLNYPEGLRGTSLAAKMVYTRLLCDDALNHAGVLPLRVALWVDQCEMPDTDIYEALRELEEKRYAYTDYKTHQVLVRTFIRNDGVADIPNVLHSACRAALTLRSEKLRRVLAGELRKLAPQPPDKIHEQSGKRYVYPDPHGTADKIDPGPPDGGDPIHGSHPASHRIPSEPMPSHVGSPGGGGGGGGSSYVRENSSKDHYSATKINTPRLVAVPNPPTAQGAVAAWHDAYLQHHDANPTRRQLAQAGREAKALLDAENPPERVLHAARQAGARGYATIETEYRNLASRSTPPPRRSTTDQRVAEALALAAKYEQLEAQEENQ